MSDLHKKTCVLYCRVSSDRQVDNTSLESQERSCRSYAKSQGLTILGLFVDKGESAKTADRPEFIRALSFCAIKKRQIDYFVIYKMDRFARSQEDHVLVKAALKKSGTELRSATEHTDDTPMGQMMEGMLAVIAEFDNNVRTERTKAGMLARVQEGYWCWAPPLGYHKPKRGRKTHIVPHHEASRLVRMAFEQYSKGTFTYKALAEYLNERGYRSRYGKPATSNQIEKMIKNPVYSGVIRAFDGEYPGGFEPLVSEELFRACQKGSGALSQHSGLRTTENPHFSLKKLLAVALVEHDCVEVHQREDLERGTHIIIMAHRSALRHALFLKMNWSRNSLNTLIL